MNNSVWAVIYTYGDGYTYSGSDFNSLQLFYNEDDAIRYMLDLEEQKIKVGWWDYNNDEIEIRKIEIH